VTNLALVTDAVGHGRKAAEDIDRSFTGAPREEDRRTVIHSDKMVLSHYEKAPREVPGQLDMAHRMELDQEVNLGYTAEQLLKEADRCMSCGYCMDCEKCWMYCQDQAIHKPTDGSFPYGWKLENCTGCSKCAEICPCGFIEMH
jgi:Pyruvate/2-oxoacid:ferredoxin oxidoreductase delta subunit